VAKTVAKPTPTKDQEIQAAASPKKKPAKQPEVEACPKCEKSPELCVCAHIKAHQNNKVILILQHPQEPDHDLGTAKIAHLCLKNSQLKIGLSWRNLNHALGLAKDSKPKVPKKWAVMYLGSGVRKIPKEFAKSQLLAVNKLGEGLPDSGKIIEQLEGIVLLDGTWSQAKTLWWRNAWLLKLHRVIARPQHPSLYKELRKEPRRECLSTIESAALALEAMRENAVISRDLRETFAALLDQKRKLAKAPAKQITS
jgi:DTW domain-containing protein YfiP